MKRSVDEIFESLGIDQLQKTPHGYRGCCKVNPNHSDRKPSMHIHLEKGFVKCFSCGHFKPLFSFLIDEGVPFDDAIAFMFTDFNHDREKAKGMEEYVLGVKVPKSMIDRGYTVGTLKHFEVGYDTYERRITIPCRYNGVLYGINYRMPPKKIWASDGFVKDHYVYNYEPTEERFYVEGFTDTWRVWQNGTKNVSATLSANPSEGQLDLMRQHKRIYLAYDNDKAGFKGAFKVKQEIGREVEIFMIPYPEGDPGDCSKQVWQDAVKKATPFAEFEVRFIMNNPTYYNEISN